MTEAAQQLIPVEAAPVPAPQTESAAILQVIERAAANPAVDVDKMERLMAMHERILAKRAEAAFNTDLADLQPKLPIVGHRGEIKNKDGRVVSTYALWEDIIEAIRPMLSEHGFSLTFKIGQEGAARIVTGVLRHREGHCEQTTIALPLDTSGFKNDVQAVGSSVSYGKRYTAMALLNITSTGEDDDGAKAGAGGFITDDQGIVLTDLIKETGSDKARFLKFMEVNSLEEIKARDFTKARDKLLEKLNRK